MQAVVDRIVDDVAVLLFEDRQIQLHVPLALLPDGVSEGSWLRVDFVLDKARTAEMERKNRNLLERLIDRFRN